MSRKKKSLNLYCNKKVKYNELNDYGLNEIDCPFIILFRSNFGKIERRKNATPL